MKKILRHAFYAILAVLVCGCELFGDVFEPSYVMLENGDQGTVDAGPQEATFTIAIKSNADWTADSDKNWCKSSQVDNDVLVISVDENTTDYQRTAHVTVKTKDEVGKLEIKVVQKERNKVSVSKGTYHEILMQGGTFEVTLQHNVAYEVNIPDDVSWIHEMKSKALSTKVHTFSVDPNATGLDRKAEILFTYPGVVSGRVTVLQAGKLPKRQFGFSVIHTNMSFKEPLMTGDYTGKVFWKPGQSSPLGTYPEYTYTQNGEKTVTFDLFGQAEEFTVEFQSLEGLQEIDFSGM